jgi:hypothetical protein
MKGPIMPELIIQVNQEGMKAIQELADVALKVNGMKALQGIIQILSATKLIPPQNVSDAAKDNPAEGV